MNAPSTALQSAAGTPSGNAPDDRVDAIRYAVLRKLAPGLRHALMGELQAVQLAAEFAARSLGAGAELAEARESLGRIPRRCKDAVNTGRSLIEWIRPEMGTTVSLREGIDQCVKLAGEDWFLRGVEATIDVHDGELQVPKASLQELVVTALLVLTDLFGEPTDVHVSSRSLEGQVDVVLRAQVAGRVASIPPMRHYRKLSWADLELLARAQGVACACDGATATLQFPRIGSVPQTA